jgi:hypothetical protein
VLAPATSLPHTAQARGAQPEESIAISLPNVGAPRTGAGAWRSTRGMVAISLLSTRALRRTLPSRSKPSGLYHDATPHSPRAPLSTRFF